MSGDNVEYQEQLNAARDFDRDAEIEHLKAELDKAWRAALRQGNENIRLQDVIRKHASAMIEEIGQ